MRGGLCGNIIIDPEKIDQARRKELKAKGLSFYKREEWEFARLKDIIGRGKIFVAYDMRDPDEARIADLRTKHLSYQEDVKSAGGLEKKAIEARIKEIEGQLCRLA